MTLSARDLAAALEQPEPTQEQVDIIEAPLAPALVIAGAGSGKTETMAARVVWLVANGLVGVDHVLGMTFTRKAAGELGTRIRERLTTLAATGLTQFDVTGLEQATVTTYNAFAHRVYNQYGLLIGRDPDSTVLGEAGAWQIARRICQEADREELSQWNRGLDTLTEAVLRVARAMADNVVPPEDVVSYTHQLRSYLVDLEEQEGTSSNKSFVNLSTVSNTLPTLVSLAQEYAAVKKNSGLIEFSDQVAFALEICTRFPTVVEDYRSQFKVVLLDEYQDTSVVQARLLETLFGSTPVIAVGDPHQSIYGWRGASADNILTFPTAFADTEGSCAVFSLSTSWRNPTTVLDAANVLVSPLSEKVSVSVKELSPKPDAPRGEITVSVSSTIVDEAQEVATWLAQRVQPERTAALLCRSLKNITPFTQALEEQGVAYHVIGIGGLLDEPAVVDVVCMLRVIHDATADSELVRLLAGGKWRIGPKDLWGLSQVASWLAKRDFALQKLDTDVTQALRDSVVNDESASLVDALDFISRTQSTYDVFSNVSSEALERLRDAGTMIARLRKRAHSDVRDLVTMVIQELSLDIEARANESVRTGLASLEAFMEPVTAYAAGQERATLGGFLSWIKEAERRERLSPQSPPEEPGTVQIMTIHAAKGLEWDIVAIPRVVDGELPGNRTKADTWVGFGQLPYDFRGDRAYLPVLGWRGKDTHKDLENAYKEFVESVRKQYDDEQRRLAYVAITRAKHSLLLSASFWTSLVNPRRPGVFLTELSEAGIIAESIDSTAYPETNPLDLSADVVSWPLDPLGQRRQVVEQAAQLVTTADMSLETPWDAHIDMLIAELNEKTQENKPLALPTRVASSRFKDFIDSPLTVAQQMLRPLPEQPYKATSLGTLFHQWVEHRVVPGSYPERIDASVWESDEDDHVGIDGQALQQLRATFENSRWANLTPEYVELPIELPLAGTIFSCKIDAIYQEQTDQGTLWHIVDWKTGKPPQDAEDLELKQFQLALYRLAFSRLKGIPIEHIDAVFYFVAEDKEIRPERLYSDKELEERWLSVTGGIPL